MRYTIKTMCVCACAAVMLMACDAPDAPVSVPNTGSAVVADDHSAVNALDWVGTYKGVLPCGDCEGIETTVTLKEDKTYTLQTRYMGKGDGQVFDDHGTFVWEKDGNRIALQGKEARRFHVGENTLFHLDQEGNRIDGALADHYVLTKQARVDHDNALTERYWKLVELDGAPIGKTMRDAHFILKAHEPRVQGSGGCNGMGGRYELKENNGIRFGHMMSTMMACAEGMDVEHKFLTSLERVDAYDVQGDTLLLKDKNGNSVSRFEAVYLQ